MSNDPRDVERLTTLLHPLPATDFVATISAWLQDAHDAAASFQPGRTGPRGSWRNNTSFGTDRYQFLRGTAGSLTGELPGLEVDAAFQSVLLKLPRVGMYQLLMPAGPDGSLGDASDLRRELFGAGDHEGLISRREAWLSGRELLFLPWHGTEALGLTGLWAGQGMLSDDNHIEWDWCVNLRELLAGTAVPVPRAEDAFGPATQPTLPLRPRSEAPAASE
ncbi:MAG TPA: hypothetical protein VH969_14640 [Actinophytocola sp.]|uniref:hypothetical protein n=1 Tax=Actinophytocola sp. TaxID=1872138 RepID=UPI002F935862